VRKFALSIAALLTASLSLLPQIASADPERLDGVLTLDQAIARVQRVGFDVRAARGDAEIAAADARTARAGLLPQIGISAVALDANEPQLGMPIARQGYGAASLTVPLLTPSTRYSSLAAAAGARAALINIEASVNDAVYATVQAYRRAQLADAVLDARHLAVRDQQDHLRVTGLRVASGKSPRYTLARDRASLAVALQNEEDAASERDQARNDLVALLDFTVDSNVRTEPLATLAFAEPRDAIVTRALQQSPALLAAEQRVSALQATLGATRGAYLPSTQLTAQSYNGGSSPYLGHGGGQIQLTATLPIVDGGSRSGGVARARGDLNRVIALRDQLRVGVQRNVANAYRELEAARRNLSTAQTAQTDAEEQLRIARDRESAGKGIELEVLDALSVAGNARETVLRSLARYDNAVAAVHHAAGDRSP